MLTLHLHPTTLLFRSTFRISREAKDSSQSLIVTISDGTFTGYGEASSHTYYQKNMTDMHQHLMNCTDFLSEITDFHPEELWPQLRERVQHDMFALCALDNALWDLWGQRQGKPLYQCWGLSTNNTVPSDVTISIGPIAEVLARLDDYPDWPIYKIKLGTAEDIPIMETLRTHTTATLRIDANCAWSTETSIAHAEKLAALDVEFIEQPLHAENWDGMKQLRTNSPLPLIADESCVIETDVDRCVDTFHGINIKLLKCGGLTPARRMITRARELGLSVMMGCMSESSIGMSAIAQLLPLLDAVDMDGAVLIRNDPAQGAHLVKGACVYPRENGLGIRLRVK